MKKIITIAILMISMSLLINNQAIAVQNTPGHVIKRIKINHISPRLLFLILACKTTTNTFPLP